MGREGRSAILMYTNSQRRTVKTLERDVKFEFISSPATEDSSQSLASHRLLPSLHDDSPSSDYYGKFSSGGSYPREVSKSPRSLMASRGWSNGRNSNNEVRGRRNSWDRTSKSSRDDWLIGSSRSNRSYSKGSRDDWLIGSSRSDRCFGGSCFNCSSRGHMSSECPAK